MGQQEVFLDLSPPTPKQNKTIRKILEHPKLFSNFIIYFILGKDLENIIKLLSKLYKVIRRKNLQDGLKNYWLFILDMQLSQQSNRMIHNWMFPRYVFQKGIFPPSENPKTPKKVSILKISNNT